jgi:putative transposase
VTIQFESHWVELAGIYEMEHDAAVLEFFDQPPPIKLEYESPKENGWACFTRRTSRHPRNGSRVGRMENGGGSATPGRAESQSLLPRRGLAGGVLLAPHTRSGSLYYRVRSSAEIDRIFQRNIQFLEDYFRCSHQIVPARREAAVAHVSAAPGLMLEDLLHLTEDAIPADDIFALIAADVLYVDLCAAPLAEPAIVKVFPSREAASRVRSGGQNSPFSAVGLRCGSRITWDSRIWDVVNLGETTVSLLSGDQGLTGIANRSLRNANPQNRLKVVGSEPKLLLPTTVRDRLSRASEADLRTATDRSRLIGEYLSTGVLPTSEVVPARTFFRWLRRYRNAEATCGSDFLGLLPQSGNRGNCSAKLPESSRRLLQGIH